MYASASRRLFENETRRENDALEAYFSAYEDYLRNTAANYDLVDRCIALTFVLQNSGTQTAEDIDVMLQADTDTGVWREERPKPVAQPEVPEARRIHRIPQLTHLKPFVPEPIRGNVSGPMSVQGSPQSLRFHVNGAKPDLPVLFPVVWFEVMSFADATSFTVRYSLSAKNMRAPERGNTHVKVNLNSAT